MERNPCIGIDLFAGVGGLSHGLSRAGMSMKLGLEVDPIAAYNLKQNNKPMAVIVSDIALADPATVMKSAELKRQDIDIVVGGPPCQGFSQSNRRTRSSSNPANNLYNSYFKFIKWINPNVFLLENVAGLMTFNKGEAMHDIIQVASKLGYNVQWGIVNAADFGVPQRRKRILFIGTKKKTNTSFFENKENGTVTVKDALDDLPVLSNGNQINELRYSKCTNLSDYQKLMRQSSSHTVCNNLVTKNRELIISRYNHIPPGGNWKDIPKDLMKNYKNTCNCHGWIYYRLKWEEPSVVVSNFRKNMLIHPSDNRGLSVREAARLQSFPDDYIFYGRLDFQQQYVANAVPPLLAEKIGISLLNHIGEY